MRIIRFSDLQTVPWKNGGGVTREIAARYESQNLVWRLSLADVRTDGPFSLFPGLNRILTVIEGKGILLQTADRTITADHGAPVAFEGRLPVDSFLQDGPIKDLNVMFDPLKCQAQVALAATPASLTLRAVEQRHFAVIGLRGSTVIDHTHHLHFGDTAMLETGTAEVSFAEHASALVVTIDMQP